MQPNERSCRACHLICSAWGKGFNKTYSAPKIVGSFPGYEEALTSDKNITAEAQSRALTHTCKEIHVLLRACRTFTERAVAGSQAPPPVHMWKCPWASNWSKSDKKCYVDSSSTENSPVWATFAYSARWNVLFERFMFSVGTNGLWGCEL